MAKTDPSTLDQDITLNLQQLADLVKSLNQSGSLDAAAISEIAAKAATQASETLKDQWWDERKYPAISNFNPLGDKAHPRPELNGDIYWAGYLLRGDELTHAEIDLVNQLRPGAYEIRARDGQDLPFVVRDLDPGSKNSRRLLVLFPCTTADQRHALPSMVEMLQQIVAVPA